MSAQVSVPANRAELISTASKLWARVTSTANLVGVVAKSLPTNFDPTSHEPNLSLCCRLLEWALIEASYELEVLKESSSSKPALDMDTYVSMCDEQQRRLLACLSTVMAICELMRQTKFEYERLLLAGLIPDLDEQLSLVTAIRTGARTSHAW